jgi:hypothetical protein
MNNHPTKFQVNKSVWFIHENKVVSKPIESLKIESARQIHSEVVSSSIIYGFRIYLDANKTKFSDWLYKYEVDLFATKQDLLNSL